MRDDQRGALIRRSQEFIRRWGPMPGRGYDALTDAVIEGMYRQALETEGRSMMMMAPSIELTHKATRHMLPTEPHVYDAWRAVILRFAARGRPLPERMRSVADAIDSGSLPAPPPGRRPKGIAGVRDISGRLAITLGIAVLRAWVVQLLALNLPLESSRASPDSLASLMCAALNRERIKVKEADVLAAWHKHARWDLPIFIDQLDAIEGDLLDRLKHELPESVRCAPDCAPDCLCFLPALLSHLHTLNLRSDSA